MRLAVRDLRHRLELLAPTYAGDDTIDATVTYSTRDVVWGSLEPISAREAQLSTGLESESTHEAHIRYRSDVASDWRVSFRGRVFEVAGLEDLDERRRYLRIFLRETR